MHPALAITITLIFLGGIIMLSAWGFKTGKISGEMARKLVHVGMGLICLSFPWIFNSALPVQILACLAILTLLLVRMSRLRQSVGSALFSVERLSIGELLFPLAVAWLFTMGWDKPVIYCIALLLLTLADTAGALAGNKYGKKQYQTTAATKSLEGSVAFFVTAFLCIAIPLHFFARIPIELTLFLSLTVSLFAMAVEGASGHGLDNLLIPVGSFFLLEYYINLTDHSIFIRSLVLCALLTLLLVTQKKHTFNGGAILTAMLFGFATYTLGGIPCFLTALFLFARHLFVQSKMATEHVTTHSIDTIIAIAIPSLFWLTLGRGNVIDYQSAQFGYICTLSLVIYMLHTGTQKHTGMEKPSLTKGFVLSVIALLPALLLDIQIRHYLPTLLLGLPLARFYFYWRTSPNDDVSSHWIQLGLLAFPSSIVVMLPALL